MTRKGNVGLDNKHSEKIYTVNDLNKAFSMGQEFAVVVLEKSVGLSPKGQRRLIECLKKQIAEDKIKCILAKT